MHLYVYVFVCMCVCVYVCVCVCVVAQLVAVLRYKPEVGGFDAQYMSIPGSSSFTWSY